MIYWRVILWYQLIANPGNKTVSWPDPYSSEYNTILHTLLLGLRRNLYQSLNLPHISPQQASYGVSFVRILGKINHIITALHHTAYYDFSSPYAICLPGSVTATKVCWLSWMSSTWLSTITCITSGSTSIKRSRTRDLSSKVTWKSSRESKF